MHSQILVEQDVQNGFELVEELKNKLDISAAFWLNDEEAGEWRLIFISPEVSAGLAGSAYSRIEQVLADKHLSIPMRNIFVLGPTNLQYKQVRLANQGVSTGLTIINELNHLSYPGDAYIYVMN